MASKPRTVSGGMGVDTRDLKRFVGALRKASPVAAKGLRESLRAAGEIVAEEARTISGQHSRSIPATIKTRVYSGTVSVQAGGPDVPIAALYELGNKDGKPGQIRHPVFGGETWVTQPGFPFLKPAADHKMTEVEAMVLKVADDVVRVLRTG